MKTSAMCFAMFITITMSSIICFISCADDVYQLGVGIADITGPAAEIGMMGYAKSGQDSAGIHLRLFARTFIIADTKGTRIIMVNTDIAMVSQAVKMQVTAILKKKYNGVYHEGNVLISATHTHSGPGGFLNYVLYIMTTQGFIRQSFDAIVNGIILSIDRAHKMAETTKGSILFNEGDLLTTSINRSPTAYLQNPASERSKFKYNTDKGMQILKLVDTEGKPLGLMSWFPVHCTSMNNTNRLISGDNKGYASYLMERKMNPDSLPGKGNFVAAFINGNEGDVSPNIEGPKCIDNGMTCDVDTSTCGGQNEKCIASGPGKDMFESTKIIGERQFEKAKRLFDSAKIKVEGPLGFIHEFIDMSNQKLSSSNGTVTTCKPSMGYSFAAGTTDGPGAFDFSQGSTKSNRFWNLVRDFIRKPTKELEKCQFPKPILLATGEMKFPYAWQPSIVPTQIIRIGNILITALPAEFTTMSGRRIRQNVMDEAARSSSGATFKVLLSGLSNGYSSYVATPEEYQMQRYEGASTLFGPHTLPAYIQQYLKLTNFLLTQKTLPVSTITPPNLLSKQVSLKPGVIFDGLPYGKKFGDIVYNVFPKYKPGDQVYCAFVAANPRNDLQTEKSYLTVERKEPQGWYIHATDADWETKFYWHRTNSVFGESQVTITWDIPKDIKKGIYRVRHFGVSRSLLQQFKPYVGITAEFEIV